MEKIRVLAVAPYEGMKDVIESVAAGRDDVEVTAVVGNMEAGAAQVQACDQSRFDVIISRGGTAECIKEVASLPVIEIELTPYDVRNALAAVSGTNRKFAVAGFPGIAAAAATLCEILDIDVEIVDIHNAEEAKLVLPELKKEGVELLLCDMNGMTVASTVGMDAVLITSGVKGIEDALNKAASYFSSFGRLKLASAVYEAELIAEGEQLVVLTPGGQLLYAAPEHAVPPAIRKMLLRLTPMVLSEGSQRMTRAIGTKDYAIQATPLSYNGEQYIAFRCRSEGPRLPFTTAGVSFYEAAERDMTRISRHYGGNGLMIQERADRIAQSGLPVLVCGEKGTLTSSVAGYICMHGLLSARDCCVIDCAAVSPKGWAKLLGSSGLLLFRTGSTILFLNFLDLADSEIENLIDFMHETDLPKRIRIVFSLTTGLFPWRENKVIKLLTDQIYAVVLELPPLRLYGEQLPDIIRNGITYICSDMGMRAPDLEEEALRILAGYSWPRNFPQLHRVEVQLVTDGNGGTITAEQAEKIVNREKEHMGDRPGMTGSIDLSGTLDDISYRVVKQVLAEENMNRSSTARRLGISRATLWRILGREHE